MFLNRYYRLMIDNYLVDIVFVFLFHENNLQLVDEDAVLEVHSLNVLHQLHDV
jgi:hypothetical protein